MKKEPQSPYHVYLLRLWLEECETSQSWRFSLENVQDRQRRGFADLESLLAFLQQLTKPQS